MDASRRNIKRVIKHLREALDAGESKLFSEKLAAQASPELLTAIREQKLLTRPHSVDRQSIKDAVKAAAETALCRTDADHYLAYLEFIDLWWRGHREAVERLATVIARLPEMPFSQLLEVFDKTLEKIQRGRTSHPPIIGQSVAEYEKELHHLNGVANDTLFAALRALNEASRVVLGSVEKRIVPSRQFQMLRSFTKAIEISAELNSLEWILDSVSYGDFVVSTVENASISRVRLDHADVRRSLLRELAIRRRLVLLRSRAGAPRHLREMLKASEFSILEQAVEHYAKQAGVKSSDVDTEYLFDRSQEILRFLDAEDDLLALSGTSVRDSQYATYYFSAICLIWHELAASAVRKILPSGRRRSLASAAIPTSSVENVILRAGGTHAAKCIEDLTSTLPTKSHYDLARRPFVRAPCGETRSLPFVGASIWNTSVREILVSGGAIGDAYGRLWEDFYAYTFEESDWVLVGRNLTLRSNGRTTTDVDLLLKKGNLLLVVEVKALIGSGVSCYDHWRNLQKIEWGCRQAAVAADFVRDQRAWLASVAGNEVAAEIRHIQPLVLTTVASFDGWSFEGVPVIGEAGRKAITEGVKVEYTHSSGRVVSTRWITKPDELTTERILWTLNNPVELLIAPEGLDTFQRELRFRGFSVMIPEFDMRKHVESFPVVAETD